ncbi:MAG: ribonuclease Y [Candidatus Paraimprobicoccus trichonymphae]|uniref:Ribonuclease Y n=1 Tax=Candidatus Paraimprobicoccus trichonymphae TaxID=3033793 RepID=A0AA48HZC2_9FIRM|nr:MAG: ribonuclease Y [Candidatus Paraimprobicoccus trichonymphae]
MILEIINVVILILNSILFFILGFIYRKKKSEKIMLSAEYESKKILEKSKELAETEKKELILEGKEIVHKLREKEENEISKQKEKIQQQENRLFQREEIIEKKLTNIESKEEIINEKLENIKSKSIELDSIKKTQLELLEKISGFTAVQAKNHILDSLQKELDDEKSMKISKYEEELKEESEIKAQEILSIAIQRCTWIHSSESMISVVSLPNDEMKGRIIGREGRNIKCIEKLTGVDLVIDDTPEAITLSCFDPVRREVAKISIERLILDGRIHPTKIEEVVNKVQSEMTREIKYHGERAVLETKISVIHPELIRLLGTLKFRTSYSQNVLKHSLEVAYLCGMIAAELKLNITLARKIGLLHDIGKALDYQIEGSHVEIGADIAKKYGESEEVVNAIRSHHNDVEPETEIAMILQTADAISASRPGARRENIEKYIKRLENLERIVSSFEGVQRCYAVQAGRELRVMVKPKIITDKRMPILTRTICKRVESELTYPSQIKVDLIREFHTFGYIK